MALASVKLVMVSAVMATGRADLPAGEVVIRDEIFGNREGAEMVMKARSLDPFFVGSRGGHRDEVIALYEKAIELQPGAKINALLADRIAQLYAFTYDPKRGIGPNRAKAAEWWRQCIEETDPTQVLWAQAHMGLGGATFLRANPHEAVRAYRAVLDLDILALEWPAWKVRPNSESESGRRQFELGMIRIRDDGERIMTKAVEKIHYVLIRVDGAKAVAALADIAMEHEGLPVGDRASELLEKALQDSRLSLYRYRDPVSPDPQELVVEPSSTLASKPDSGKVAVVVGGPASSPPQPQRAAAKAPEPTGDMPAPAGATGRSWTNVWIGLAVATVVVAGALLIWRLVVSRGAS